MLSCILTAAATAASLRGLELRGCWIEHSVSLAITCQFQVIQLGPSHYSFFSFDQFGHDTTLPQVPVFVLIFHDALLQLDDVVLAGSSDTHESKDNDFFTLYEIFASFP